MMRAYRTAPTVVLLGCLGLAACKHPPPKPPPPPKPAVVKLNLVAAPDSNPDVQNRASPIVVRVYQLKDDAAFKDADFFSLYDKESATLGSALIAREEFELAPGEQRAMDYQVSLDARFVGVAAAYRDIRTAGWRAEIGSQDKGLTDVSRKTKFLVTLRRASVSVSAE